MANPASRLGLLPLAGGLALALVYCLLAGFGNMRSAQARPLATTFAVSNTNDSGSGSLREAILNANATPGADVISITAVGTVNLLSALPQIIEAVTIQGPGASQFAVDGNDSLRVFDIATAGVEMSDLTVQRGSVTGSGANGAGIRSTGALTLTNVNVLSNTAQSHGGGLYVIGNLMLTNGLFQNNRSTNGLGGGMYSSGAATISGAHFVDNASQGDGGGALTLGSLTLVDGLFQANQCTSFSCDGGGLSSFSSTDILGTQFISNTAQDHGGGLQTGGTLTIINGLFQENQSVFSGGAGLYSNGTANISATQFLSNTARSFGGGMYALGTATLTDGLFLNNQSTMVLGGGLHATTGAIDLINMRFIRNTALRGGGAHFSAVDARLVNTLFAGNEATSAQGSEFTINSLVDFAMINSTIASPAVTSGSAIYVITGTVGITNSIITSHTLGIEIEDGSVNQDFNLFFGNGTDVQGSFSGGANNVTGDPHFASPASDNYHLRAGSAAVDVGTNAGVTTDIDGEPRPLVGGFDIGYDEANLITGLDIAYTPVPAEVGEVITFTASISSGIGVTYDWDFGDGTPVESGNPVAHIFAIADVYTVTVTAANSADSVFTTTQVQIAPPLLDIFLPLLMR